MNSKFWKKKKVILLKVRMFIILRLWFKTDWFYLYVDERCLPMNLVSPHFKVLFECLIKDLPELGKIY